MSKYLRIDLGLLVLSAVGALGLSGTATYHFFLPFGEFTAIMAVLAVEGGLAGFVLGFKPLDEARPFWNNVWHVFEALAVALSIILGLAVAMTANLLYKTDVLGISIADSFQRLIKLGALTFVIPLLALVALERARLVFDRVRSLTEPESPAIMVSKDMSRKERLKLIEQDLLGGISDQQVLADKYAVSPSTVSRDVKYLRKKLKTKF